MTSAINLVCSDKFSVKQVGILHFNSFSVFLLTQEVSARKKIPFPLLRAIWELKRKKKSDVREFVRLFIMHFFFLHHHFQTKTPCLKIFKKSLIFFKIRSKINFCYFDRFWPYFSWKYKSHEKTRQNDWFVYNLLSIPCILTIFFLNSNSHKKSSKRLILLQFTNLLSIPL
mgnify:CR=1 FL=1